MSARKTAGLWLAKLVLELCRCSCQETNSHMSPLVFADSPLSSPRYVPGYNTVGHVLLDGDCVRHVRMPQDFKLPTSACTESPARRSIHRDSELSSAYKHSPERTNSIRRI